MIIIIATIITLIVAIILPIIMAMRLDILDEPAQNNNSWLMILGYFITYWMS